MLTICDQHIYFCVTILCYHAFSLRCVSSLYMNIYMNMDIRDLCRLNIPTQTLWICICSQRLHYSLRPLSSTGNARCCQGKCRSWL